MGAANVMEDYLEDDVPLSKQLKRAKKSKTTDLSRMNTGAILWFLVKKHKMAISVTLNVVLLLDWANVLPILVDLIRG